MKTVIITGASGFLAQSIFRSLKGHYKFIFISRKPSSFFDFSDNLSFSYSDLECNDVRELIASMNPFALIHCAGLAHKYSFFDDYGLQFFEANVLLTRKVSEFARSICVPRFIFLSTVSVYGENHMPAVHLSVESDTHPSSFYGISKLLAEKTLFEVFSDSSVSLSIVRPCLVYSPSSPGSIRLLRFLSKLTIPIPAPSWPVFRSYLSLSLFIDSIRCLLSSPSPLTGTFLLADPHPHEVKDFMSSVCEFGSKPQLFFVNKVLFRLLLRIPFLNSFLLKISSDFLIDPLLPSNRSTVD